MEVPPNVQILATLKSGSVYKFTDDSLTSNTRHYFIVLNNDPNDDQLLLLVCSTTKIAKTKHINKNLPPSTLVDIYPNEYADFKQDSIINCNTVFLRTKEELIQKLTDKQLEIKSKMPTGIVDKLKEGVLQSPLIEEAIKRILRR